MEESSNKANEFAEQYSAASKAVSAHLASLEGISKRLRARFVGWLKCCECGSGGGTLEKAGFDSKYVHRQCAFAAIRKERKHGVR